MAEYEAITDVGETLVTMLRDRMGDLISREKEIALVSPGDVGAGNDIRLSLFLFQVAEDGHRRNAERRMVSSERVRNSPLELDLHYLLTAHPSKGSGDPTSTTKEQHSVLGRAMQVLHDTPVLRGSDLTGSLAGSQEFRVLQDPKPTDEILNIWNTFAEKPYQPSVSYLVTPITIESTRERTTARIRERTIEEDMRTGRGNPHE